MDYHYDHVTHNYVPGASMYPGEKSDKWHIPEEIQNDFLKLNSIIETKYGREFLKICAFYNKMFPSLKSSEWTRTSYNVPPFTYMDQEHADTGTGTSTNYLKQIIDQLTSRLGTIAFIPKLIQEEPTLDYVCYKDDAERFIRSTLRNARFNRTNTEVFHDAAVLGYSHVFIDPYTGKITKASDYEIGLYESQFNKGIITQMLYRDYAFPVAQLGPYLEGEDEDTLEKINGIIHNKSSCDFKMFFDADRHVVCVTIGGCTLSMHEYNFDHVLITTFMWDVGFSKVTSTSLFDTLYPIQREINKINAKIQQLIRMYKGATPVFNSDVDLAMKQISNGSGECLYVDSARPIDTLMTVINPTPLDSELSAQITERKTQMYELAGIQAMSFNMDNMRSAAAVVALDQTRDTTFQAQLQGIAQFAKDVLYMQVEWNANQFTEEESSVDWQSIWVLLQSGQIDMQPVHTNNPLGNDDADENATTPDYIQLQTSRTVLAIIKNKLTWDSIPYYIDKNQLKVIVAVFLIKFSALGIDIPDSIHRFLIAAFIDAVKTGEVTL